MVGCTWTSQLAGHQLASAGTHYHGPPTLLHVPTGDDVHTKPTSSSHDAYRTTSIMHAHISLVGTGDVLCYQLDQPDEGLKCVLDDKHTDAHNNLQQLQAKLPGLLGHLLKCDGPRLPVAEGI